MQALWSRADLTKTSLMESLSYFFPMRDKNKTGIFLAGPKVRSFEVISE